MVQEEAAMIPVLLLDLKPGERVLDLCAAPGNKTAQLSVALGDTGTVVANDSSLARLGVLQGSIDRLGLTNVVTTVHDARSFPVPPEGYDAVLADVPCSCEGTSRKNPEVLFRNTETERSYLTTVQKGILRRAIECAKPGGMVVYSTCTYAPEENEAVIHEILQDTQLDVELVPINLPGFKFSSGLSSWQGQSFDSSISRCARVWPHENNTGGFFIALLKKNGAATDSATGAPSIKRESSPYNASEPTLPIKGSDWPWIAHWFMQSDLDPWCTHPFSQKYGRMAHKGLVYDPQLNLVNIGMTGLNLKSQYPKFSTALALKMGHLAKTGVVSIEVDQLGTFWNRSSIPWATVNMPDASSQTVFVQCEGTTVGLATINPSKGLVESRFPKVWGGLEVQDRVRKLQLG